jgi:hypothetical protein
VLRARCGGLLELVRALIGVVPDCDSYLEIWPTGSSPSPVQVDRDVVARRRELPAAAIVEVVTFVALMPLLHRIGTFYAAVDHNKE